MIVQRSLLRVVRILWMVLVIALPELLLQYINLDHYTDDGHNLSIARYRLPLQFMTRKNW